MPKPGSTHRFHTASKETPAAKARAKQYASPQHRNTRRALAVVIAQGRGICWRCHQPIPASTPSRQWHVGHDDHNRSITQGPEHAHCNLSAAAKAGNRAQRANRHPHHTQSRQWI